MSVVAERCVRTRIKTRNKRFPIIWVSIFNNKIKHEKSVKIVSLSEQKIRQTANNAENAKYINYITNKTEVTEVYNVVLYGKKKDRVTIKPYL